MSLELEKLAMLPTRDADLIGFGGAAVNMIMIIMMIVAAN